MLNFYKTINNSIVEVDEIESGVWVSAIAPTESEISKLENELGLDRDFIRSALDEEETSRIEDEENQTLIVLDYPVMEKSNDADETISYYTTMPMGIILTNSNVITVCLKENQIITDFATGVVKNVQTNYKTRFVFCMLLRIAGKYLQYLKQIDKIISYVESQLNKSMQNKGLIEFLGLKKSLVYFSTSLKSTETVLEKLLRGRIIKLYEEDQDLLEDVLIEVKQAIEMSNIYSNILSSTMDAFSNVINNNLNVAMKVLTVITIVMEIPNMIFSFYGMNTVDLPFPYTWLSLGLSVVLAAAAGIILIKSKLYK